MIKTEKSSSLKNLKATVSRKTAAIDDFINKYKPGGQKDDDGDDTECACPGILYIFKCVTSSDNQDNGCSWSKASRHKLVKFFIIFAIFFSIVDFPEPGRPFKK